MVGLGQKALALLKMSRPFTLLAPAVGGLLFSYLGYLHAGGNPVKIVLTAWTLVMANYTSNVINQIYDREIDKINKPYRPIPAGLVSVDEANSLAIILTILTLTLAYTLINTLFGLLLTTIMFFAWIYSAPPLRLRAKLFWSNLALATPRGGLGIIAAYSSYANPLDNPNLLVFALAMAVYVFGGNTFKDIPDEPGDKACGVRNFVTVFGRDTAILIAKLSILLSMSIVLWTQKLLPIVPLIFYILIEYFTRKHPELKTKTENTVLWTLFYLMMAAYFATYFVAEVLWR